MATMRTRRGRLGRRLTGLCMMLALATACGGHMPTEIGATGGRLAECPDSPNCVSSFAEDEPHRVEALVAAGRFASAWAALREVVDAMPRTEVMSEAPGYLHVVETSLVMRYRDDVEFLADEASGRIHVRSASRVGYGDMGVNRARVEAIRKALVERGVVRSSIGY